MRAYVCLTTELGKEPGDFRQPNTRETKTTVAGTGRLTGR